MLTKLLRRNNHAPSFDEEKRKYGPVRPERSLYEAIEVDKIVGSVDRWQDLDRKFRWKGTKANDYRTRSVTKAMERGEILPPIEVYELDNKYFVVDGHHRVEAAKKLGQAYMDAKVTKFVPT